MKPSEYVKNVLITESCDFPAIKGRIDDKMIRLLHAGLGLSSELSELSLAHPLSFSGNTDWVNIAEECGDLTWYAAIAVNVLGFDHEEISLPESQIHNSGLKLHSTYSFEDCLLTAVYSIGEYNDLLKKHLFYGKEFDTQRIKFKLQQLCMAIAGLCFVAGTTIEEVRQTNINKLRARYGEKFTEAAALNRDLETERKILEEGKS